MLVGRTLLVMIMVLCCHAYSVEARSVDRLDLSDFIPDMLQTDSGAEFSSGGRFHCGPVAASNTLMWLDSAGYPLLVENSGGPWRNQVSLVRSLASAEYMNTRRSIGGTYVGRFLYGIDRYIRERGYVSSRIEYQGWSPVPVRYDGGVDVPDMNSVRRAFGEYGSIWLNIGWYRQKAECDEYRRVSGHWLTMVGYDENVLIVHDSAPWSGRKPLSHRLKLCLFREGRLTGRVRGLPRSARGYHFIVEGLHMSPRADLAVIDGVAILKMERPFPFLRELRVDGMAEDFGTFEASAISPCTDLKFQPGDNLVDFLGGYIQCGKKPNSSGGHVQ